jgi:hypothetical protein
VQEHQKSFWINGVKFMMDNNIHAELKAEIDRARVAGSDTAETEPRAIKAWYAADTERIFIECWRGWLG